MKPYPLAIALAVTLLPTFAASQQKFLGKTEAEVLQMGQDKFLELVYSDSESSTTQGVSEAFRFYASAAKKRNAKLAAKAPKGTASNIVALRNALSNVIQPALEAEYIATGKGTMYIPMFESRSADLEDFLYGILTKKELPSADMTAEGLLDEINNFLDSMNLEAEADPESEAELKDAKAKSVAGGKSLVNVLKKFKPEDQGKVVGFLLSKLKRAVSEE